MKKIILAAAVVLTTGVLSSFTIDKNVKLSANPINTTVYGNGQDPKNLGSGDANAPIINSTVYGNGQDPKNLGSGDANNNTPSN